MDMEDLRKLALLYGVPPAALLMDPEVADGELTKMRRAAGIAANMTDRQADAWFTVAGVIDPPE